MNDAAQLQVNLTSSPSSSSGAGNRRQGSWFEAMADAWGKALDNQANAIVERSEGLEDGIDSPREITLLSAETQRMSFLSNSAHTAITAVGTSLETMARKQ